MRSSYMDYAMSVIVGRALPDARDGLKPVHRRVLYSMQQLGLQPNRPYVKCAKVVGDCMGDFHPARRRVHLRRARPARAAVLVALPARRRPGQLRQRRRLRRGRDAVHRVPSLAHGGRDAARPRRGRRRLRAELRRAADDPGRPAVALPEPARERRIRASRSAWRRTSRRTTSARSSTPRSR